MNLNVKAISKSQPITLEFLINVGLRLLIFGCFLCPYALIRDPTLIFICEYESDPMLIRNGSVPSYQIQMFRADSK